MLRRLIFAAIWCLATEITHAACKPEQQAAERALHDRLMNGSSFENFLSGDPKTIARAEEFFDKTCDDNRKLRTASILVSIRVSDPKYFSYLRREANAALDIANSMPFPAINDSKGNPT